MKKSFLNKFIIAIFFAIAIILAPKLTEANSFSVSASKSTLKAGETATITVSTPCTGRFNISCTNGKISADKLWLENSSGIVNVTANRKWNNSYNYTTKSTFYTKWRKGEFKCKNSKF